jgi:hypothetical protein
MVSVFTGGQIMGSGTRPGQTKDYKIVIGCSSTKNTVLRGKNKEWLARNQVNESELSRLLLQWASTINIQLSMLV